MGLDDALRQGLSSSHAPGSPAGIEFRQRLRPAAGMSVKPPSYDGELEIHPRQIDGEIVQVIELDSVGSSANRIEDALLDLYRDDKYPLPVAATKIEPSEQESIIVTTLEAPHRCFDAWIRLSEDADGTRFEDTERGRDLTLAHPRRLDALLETSTHDLLFGVWDSHRKGPHGQIRIGRSLTTTLLGVNPRLQHPVAARRDPLNLGDASDAPKGHKRLSEMGLSSIPPQRTKPSVTIDYALYQGFLSFAALRRLGFERYDETDVRVLLALLALYGLLLRDEAGWDLRSGAALVPDEPIEFEVAFPGRTAEPLELELGQVRELFDEAVRKVNIADRKISLTAGATLNGLVNASIATTAAGEK